MCQIMYQVLAVLYSTHFSTVLAKRLFSIVRQTSVPQNSIKFFSRITSLASYLPRQVPVSALWRLSSESYLWMLIQQIKMGLCRLSLSLFLF